MRLTIDLLRELINGITATVKINSVTSNGDGTYTVLTCNTHWLFDRMVVEIGGNDYTVLSVVDDVSFVIQGDIIPIVPTFDLGAPYFYHGTLVAANLEFSKITDDLLKTPFIYCVEPFKDKFMDFNSSKDRISYLRLFFMKRSDIQSYGLDDYYNLSIKPMNKLVDAFIKSINKSKLITNFEGDHSRINHQYFGYYEKNGALKTYFDSVLSGVECNFELGFQKIQECKC